MKTRFSNILLLASFFAFTSVSFAQENERPEEIQKIIDDNQERFVFELTHDRADGDDAPDIATLSRGVNVYYMKNIPLGESKFSVAPGLGIANRQLYMKNIYDFDASSGMVSLIDVPENLERNVSKLNFTYLEAPVELRWASQQDKRGHSFKVATGFRAGYMLSSKFKYTGQVFTDDYFVNDGNDVTYTEKLKLKKLENLVRYRVAPSFRVGYGSVNLFGYYQVNNDFDAGRGPKMNGYSLGVSISSF